MYKYFKKIASVRSGNYIYFWKPKGLSDERINSITASNYGITSEISYYGTKTRVTCSGSCLKQDKATYNHGAIVNIYIVYEISKNYNISKYSGYGIGFDRKGEFSFVNGFGRNVIIFVADMSSSVHANNKTKNILVLGKDFIQGLDNTTIHAETLCSINFTKTNTKFFLSLHYNGANSYLILNVEKFINLKQKIPRLWPLHYVWESFQNTFL